MRGLPGPGPGDPGAPEVDRRTAPPAAPARRRWAQLLLRPLAVEEARAHFWRQHVRVGVLLSEVSAAVVMAYVLLADRPHRLAFVVLAAAVVICSPALLLLPIERLSRDVRGPLLFYAWSIVVTGVIGAVALLDGGAGSPLIWLIVLTLIFAGLAYPPLGVMLMGCVMVGVYLTVAVVSSTSAPETWVVAAVLLAFTVMTAWVSRNQWDTYDKQLALAARLAVLADRDFLTNCLNRRAFSERLQRALEAAGEERPVSVCLIDLDGFKQVNDLRGHAAGDRVLIGVATTLLAAVRETDHVSRLGGDEFAILMPGVGAEAARAVAERVVDELRAVNQEYGVTGSVGTATVHAPTTEETLLHEADQAMYVAKSAGGDQAQYAAA